MAAPALPDLLAPGMGTALVLTALRVGGLVLIAPAWSAKVVPMRLRSVFIVLLAVLLLPGAAASANVAQLAITPATFLQETVVGFVLGLAAALVIAAAEFAGELMSTSMGLSGAAIFDPVNNTQGAILATFMQTLALVLLVGSGGHVVMVEAVGRSFAAVPLGAGGALGDGLLAAARMAGGLFRSGTQFAAPVMASLLVANVALSILGRAAPQLNIMTLAFPLQIGVGLLTLAGALGVVARELTDWAPGVSHAADTFFRAMQAIPGTAGRR
ncbi:MAG: flagellar biosynthetic protein FliR [Gemmatimonadetes bacterium]|nr:flagellar biosynthetic protein FliR [Gemmatimonadota bacterium]